MRDKFRLDAVISEQSSLREAKANLESDQDRLYRELQERDLDAKGLNLENQELKRKIKKLEKILYGRK